MNKIIPILSFLVLLTYSLLGQTVVSIPNVTSPIGEEVLVPINATINNVGSVNINVEYDKNVLTFVEVTNNNLTGGGFAVNPKGDSLISIGWFSTTPVDIASKLLDLKFVYKGGVSPVSFVGTNQISDGNSDPINVTFTDGSVGPEPIKLTLSDEVGVPGDTVAVKLSAVNLENVGAMQLYIDYDDTKVTYVGLGENTAGFVDKGVANRVNLAMFNADGFDHSSGILATLKFVIVAGNTDVDFNSSSFVNDVNNNNIAVTYVNGSVGEVPASLVLGNVTALAGTEVSIPLSGVKLKNIGSMNLDVTYDASVLEFVRIDNVVSGNLVGNADGGTLSLAYLNAEGLDLLDGKVADLVFNYVKGSSALTFDVAKADVKDVDFAPVALAYVNGSIDESSYTPPAFVKTLPDTTIAVNSTLVYQYTATGQNLVFALVSGPTGVAVDSTGNLSWTPVYGQAGVYSVVVSLDDGVTTLIDTATVTVTGEEQYVYEISEDASNGKLANSWFLNGHTGTDGKIYVADSTGSAWGSHVIVFEDSAYTGLIHPQELALSNYTVQADIYIIGSADANAPLYTGLAIRMAGSEFQYYRFVYRNSSSSHQGQLKLQGYNGSWHISAAWNPDVDFPALKTGFHNFKVRVHEGEFQCFIDGQLLPGGPYVDSSPFMAKGYPGIFKYNGGFGKVIFDNFKVQATSVPEQKVVTIKEIQGEGDASDMIGLAVKTTGIVTASNSKGFFLQDSVGAWNGIYVYNNGNPAIGDEVTITAFVKEYYDLTELYDVVGYDVNSSGNELPAPEVITAGDLGEPYEGVLVSIKKATITNPDLGHGEWEITDTTGSARVDDVFYSATVDSGLIVDVTGIGYYSFGNYKLLPRDSNDVDIDWTGVDENTNSDLDVPVEYELSQNYPNPFNPSTTIKYAIPQQSHVQINVYNTLGQLVSRLVDSDIAAGYHEINFNASNLASGVYFYSIQAKSFDGSKNFQIVKKMMLVK